MSRSPRRPVYATSTAVAALLGAVALAGCGGSGSAAETSPLGAATPVAAVATPHQVRSGRRHAWARHRSRVAAVHKPGPRQANGPTAAFSPVATGNPQALDRLASTVDPAHGSEASAAATSAPPLPAGQFVAAADAICSSYRHSVRATGASAVTLVTQENELSALVGETATALKRLHALSPPAGEAALVGKLIALTRASVGEFVKAQTHSNSTSEAAGTATETKDMSLAQSSGKDALGAKAAAHKLGLHVCGSLGAEWL